MILKQTFTNNFASSVLPYMYISDHIEVDIVLVKLKLTVRKVIFDAKVSYKIYYWPIGHFSDSSMYIFSDQKRS